MIIFSMTATFGCLQNETLRLRDGLNILEEANEGGKSTWCAFLRAMFYGLESRKGGALSEKNRYIPWSGAPMRGEMELSWQGQRITLYRFAKGPSPFGGFKAVYTGTEEPVAGLTGDNVGETILGVTKEVYQRTCFIPQGGIQIDGSADLERRVAALATAGQEDVSFSATERTLKDWRNAIRSNRATGSLPRLQSRKEGLEQTLEQIRLRRQRQEDAKGELEALKAQKAELEEDLARHDAVARQGRAARLNAAKRDLTEKENLYRQRLAQASQWGEIPAQEELQKARGEVAYLNAVLNRKKQAEETRAQAEGWKAECAAQAEASPFAAYTPEEAQDLARQGFESLTGPRKTRFAHWIPMLGCFLAALALIVVGLVTRAIHMAILLGVGGGLLAAGVVISLALSAGGRRKRRKEGEARMERFAASDPQGLLDGAAEYARLRGREREAIAAAEQARGTVEELEKEYDQGWKALEDFCRPFAPEVDGPVTVTAALNRALTQESVLSRAKADYEAAHAVYQAVAGNDTPEEDTPQKEEESLPEPKRERSEDEALLLRVNHAIALYADQLARAQGELATLGDQNVEGDLAEVNEAIAGQEAQYEALTLALESLSAANATLQSRFSPAVNQAAGEIMAQLTGGRYSALSFTREFQALADSGDGLRASPFLSQGTADQIYLALRLAICRLTFFQEELPPVVLDDALVSFDDTRLYYALELLSDLSRDRQVLLFTCQSREGLSAQRLDEGRRSRINLP